MAKALAPAYLRIGGTAADLLTFKINPPPKLLQQLKWDQITDGEQCYCSVDAKYFSELKFIQYA